MGLRKRIKYLCFNFFERNYLRCTYIYYRSKGIVCESRQVEEMGNVVDVSLSICGRTSRLLVDKEHESYIEFDDIFDVNIFYTLYYLFEEKGLRIISSNRFR